MKLVLLLLAVLVAGPAYADFDNDIQSVNLYAGKNILLPGKVQKLYDYVSRTDGQPVYQGLAIIGEKTSSADWAIYQYTYDVSNNITSRKTAYGAWDSRASLVYA